MLNIVPCSDHENLPVVRHGDHVFHTALELVKKGETKFRVSRDDGEDYDLEYTENMNLFPGPVKTMIMKSTGGQDLHPLFLDYDENLKDSICLDIIFTKDYSIFLKEEKLIYNNISKRSHESVDVHRTDYYQA